MPPGRLALCGTYMASCYFFLGFLYLQYKSWMFPLMLRGRRKASAQPGLEKKTYLKMFVWFMHVKGG